MSVEVVTLGLLQLERLLKPEARCLLNPISFHHILNAQRVFVNPRLADGCT